MERTYRSYRDWDAPSLQTEYTEETPLLGDGGTLLARGWARRNVFGYDRDKVRAKAHRKEWDFYQISDGRHVLQLVFANITLGGYVSATLLDLAARKVLATSASYFVGQSMKHALPPKGDVPNRVQGRVGKAVFDFDTREREKTLFYQNGGFSCDLRVELPEGGENITTVLPFEGRPDRYFMTTKQNCLPCEGTVAFGGQTVSFDKCDTFCVLDWGRVCTPYRLVWYWGNGSTRITDAEGRRHSFGFEITWGIGSEAHATETCLFYDGRAHKFGAVDVEEFPKPDGFERPWRFVSEDGRFDFTMTPFFDHHSDLNLLLFRMHSHQVHGFWSGRAVLDDGTVLEIRDMYAFCEYVENRW